MVEEGVELTHNIVHQDEFRFVWGNIQEECSAFMRFIEILI
jgi:hypothetical protein